MFGTARPQGRAAAGRTPHCVFANKPVVGPGFSRERTFVIGADTAWIPEQPPR